MGTQPALYVFDYRYYQEALVPPLRDLIVGRPASEFLREVLERFGRRNGAAEPFRLPERGYCQFLAAQEQGCFCLRHDLGLEPDHYLFWPGHREYRPLDPQNPQCGLHAGMNCWFHDEEDFVNLFNGLIAANCLTQEHYLSRYMYLWDCLLEDDDRLADDLRWIGACTNFLAKSKPLFLALYRRGRHLGSDPDMGGIMGWLTPDEAQDLAGTIEADLSPPPFDRPKEPSAASYNAWYGYEIYDDLCTILQMCKLAASSQSGLAASYLLILEWCGWAKIRK